MKYTFFKLFQTTISEKADKWALTHMVLVDLCQDYNSYKDLVTQRPELNVHVMWLSEDKRICMLTAGGERIWSQLHPTSKYRLG